MVNIQASGKINKKKSKKLSWAYHFLESANHSSSFTHPIVHRTSSPVKWNVGKDVKIRDSESSPMTFPNDSRISNKRSRLSRPWEVSANPANVARSLKPFLIVWRGAGSEVWGKSMWTLTLSSQFALGFYPNGGIATRMQPPTSKIRSKYHHCALTWRNSPGRWNRSKLADTIKTAEPCAEYGIQFITAHTLQNFKQPCWEPEENSCGFISNAWTETTCFLICKSASSHLRVVQLCSASSKRTGYMLSTRAILRLINPIDTIRRYSNRLRSSAYPWGFEICLHIIVVTLRGRYLHRKITYTPKTHHVNKVDYIWPGGLVVL
jgi:hypothetical protein